MGKKSDEKKWKQDEQTLADSSPTHGRSQAKCQLTTNQLH